MASYYNNAEKRQNIDLCTYDTLHWKMDVLDEEDREEAKEERWIPIVPLCGQPEDYFEEVNPLYPDIASYCKYVKLYYRYEGNDPLELKPIATYITYPAFESRGEDVPNDEFERPVTLSKREVGIFSKLLQAVVGDQHVDTPIS